MRRYMGLAFVVLGLLLGLIGCTKEGDVQRRADRNAGLGQLFINEVMTNGDEADWIELYNAGDRDLDISGYRLSRSKKDLRSAEEAFTIPARMRIPPKGFVVFERDKEGDGSATFKFGLAKEGVVVYLFNPSNRELDRVDVPDFSELANQSWGRQTDGHEQWQLFAYPTKGAKNIDGVVPGGGGDADFEKDVLHGVLFINEVLSYGDAEDWIELYNAGEAEVDLSGYRLATTKDLTKAEEVFTIPAGVKLSAKGYLVFDRDKANTDGTTFTFGLGKTGETLYLFGTGETEVDRVEIGDFSEKMNQSYGRKSDGAAEWIVFETPTKRAKNEVVGGSGSGGSGDPGTPGGDPGTPVDPNAGKGVVFLNETLTNGDAEDWIELYNAGDADLDLSGYRLSKTEDLTKSEDVFTLPTGAKISAKGHLVFERDKNSTDGSTFTFGLAKEGVTLYLFNPAGTQIDRVDVVAFDDTKKNQSYGRKSDGVAEWIVFETPTKGAKNEVVGGSGSGGSGAAQPDYMSIRINEVMSKDKGDGKDWIELYNTSDKSVNLKGCILKDEGAKAEDEKYVIGDVTIDPLGFAVFDEGTHFQFGVKAEGETLTLFKPDGVSVIHTFKTKNFDDSNDYGKTTAAFPDGSTNLKKRTATKGAANVE